MSKVDAKMRRIKKIYRSIKSELLWSLPPDMVRDIVTFAVLHINIMRTMAINKNVHPIDYKKELQLTLVIMQKSMMAWIILQEAGPYLLLPCIPVPIVLGHGSYQHCYPEACMQIAVDTYGYNTVDYRCNECI